MKNNYTLSIIYYTLALLLFLLPQSLMAQLRVDDFSERIYDTSGNAPKTRKNDQNGDRCALIKIFAPPVEIEKFYFDGGAKGIQATEIHGGEIWIYVPASAQKVAISHPRFERIDYQYPMPLKKGSTYQLLLNVGGGRFLTINGDGAEKARIFVNESNLGETPVYRYYLPFGTYQIRAEKKNMKGSISVNVTEGEGTMYVTVPMTRQEEQMDGKPEGQKDKSTEGQKVSLPINYLKDKWGLYFGAGYTLTSLSGMTGYVGGVYRNVDLQLSYTLGMSSSKDVYMYDEVSGSNTYLGANTFKVNSLAARLGYQVRMSSRLGITPQVGFMQQVLRSSVSHGTGMYADGAKASCLTIGAKLLAVPAHHVYLFLTPEFAMGMSKDDTFDMMAKAGDFKSGGFSVSVGVMINLGK